MKVIKPDHDRRIEIPGVPEPVRRPVDIDQSKTEFKNLRTLRIYRFDPDSVIDGHAEEDEVFIVLLAGSAKLTMSANGEEIDPVVLNAASESSASACAAYLPPNGVYQLVPETQCDVAYARATPVGTCPAKILAASNSTESVGITVLMDGSTQGEKLRIRMLRLEASGGDVVFSPMDGEGTDFESLMHLLVTRAGSATIIDGPGSPHHDLESWDTLVVAPGELPKVRISAGASAQVLIVGATV